MNANPSDHVSQNFTLGEFFPARLFPELPEAELLILTQFVSRTLQPLRDFINAPIIVNVGDSQSRGWRGIDEVQHGPGAAGLISDHMLLEINPVATGAVDISCYDFSATELVQFVAALSAVGKVEEPREAIWEVGRRTQWVHVSFNELIKQRLEIPQEFKKARAPRPNSRNAPHRYWKIESARRTEIYPLRIGV